MPVHAGELFITRYEYKIAVARYNPYPIAFLFLSKAKNDMHHKGTNIIQSARKEKNNIRTVPKILYPELIFESSSHTIINPRKSAKITLKWKVALPYSKYEYGSHEISENINKRRAYFFLFFV